MTKGNESAFPEIFTDRICKDGAVHGDTYSTGGLTKREYFAGIALQGLLSNPNTQNQIRLALKESAQGMSADAANKVVAVTATRISDAMIEALEKTK